MSLEKKGSRYINDVLQYCGELLDKSDISSITIKDILGFEPPEGANVFLPYIKCVPLTALFPLYDRLTVGIPKIEKVSRIQDEIGLTFDDIVTLAHKKKLTLFIKTDCRFCLEQMSGVVQRFVENDVPLIFSGSQEELLALKAAETADIDLEEGKRIEAEYSKLIESPKTREMNKRLRERMSGLTVDLLGGDKLTLKRFRDTTYPIEICSRIKPTAEYLQEVIEIGRKGCPSEQLVHLVERLHIVPHFLLAKTLHSTLSSNITCKYLYNFYGIEKDLGRKLPKQKLLDYFDPTKLDFIEKKLHIAYSEDIPLEEYVEIFDSETTNGMRKIIYSMKSATTSKTSFIALQNLINEYNQEVNELILRETKRAKIVYATSDILRSNAEAIRLLIEGMGEKFANAPQKAWDCIALPRRYRSSISKWLKQKMTRVESKLVGVSPEIIHLYRVRTCLDKLKQTPKNAQ